jgi:hypothetical protein
MRWAANARQPRRFPVIALPLLLSLLAGIPAALHSEPSKATPKDRKQAKPAQKDKISRLTYDVADLLQKSRHEYRALGVQPRPHQSAIETLADLICRTVHPESWRGEGASSLQVMNGTKLEVRTNAAQHKEIADLLAALRRLTDLAVVVKAELYEIDRGFYEKQIGAKLGKDLASEGHRFALPIDEGEVKKFRKQAMLLRSNQVTIGNAQEAEFFSLRKAVLYRAKHRPAANKTNEIYETTFPGMSFQAHVVVSADRRRVRMKIRQQVTDLAGMRKEKVDDPQTGLEITVETPKLRELSTAATVQVGDGRFVLVPVLFRPKAVKAKDRVLVLLVRPIIYIEEEERERKKKNPPVR